MEGVEIKVKQASKFVDNFIKVVTFLSFVLFASTFYIYLYRSGDIYKNQVSVCDTVWSQGMTNQNPLENPIQESFLEFKNNCFNNAGRTALIWGKIAFIALDITFLLPLIYFGSKKMVKDSAEKLNKVESLM